MHRWCHIDFCTAGGLKHQAGTRILLWDKSLQGLFGMQRLPGSQAVVSGIGMRNVVSTTAYRCSIFHAIRIGHTNLFSSCQSRVSLKEAFHAAMCGLKKGVGAPWNTFPLSHA